MPRARVVAGCAEGRSAARRSSRVRRGRPPRQSFRIRLGFGFRHRGEQRLPCAAVGGAGDVGDGAHGPHWAAAAIAPSFPQEQRSSGPPEYSRRLGHRRPPAIVATLPRAPGPGGADDDGGEALAPGHRGAHPPLDRPGLASLRGGLYRQPARLANLPSAGVAGGVAGVGAAADRVRHLAMRRRRDRHRPGRPRGLHSAFGSLHLPWERSADRRKNAASGRFLERR